MKKTLIKIMKWIFLILFLAALVYGFTAAQMLSEKLQSRNFQEGAAS